MNRNIMDMPAFPITQIPEGTISLARGENFIEREFNSNCKTAPYPNATALKHIIAEQHDVDVTQVILGSGALDVINIGIRALVTPGDICFVIPNAYIGIQHMVSMHECRHHVNEKGVVLINICPNNPTGERRMDRPGDSFYDAIIVDETYADYYPDEKTWGSMVNEKNNIFAVRSFSKAHAMAGMRIGYGLCSKEFARQFSIVENKYALSTPQIAMATEALTMGHEFFNSSLIANKESLDILETGLNLLGIKQHPRVGNFICARVPLVPEFYVRPLDVYKGYGGWSRITSHTPTIMKMYLEAVEQAL